MALPSPNRTVRSDCQRVYFGLRGKIAMQLLAAIVGLLYRSTLAVADDLSAGHASLSAAICPIVYPVDESPSAKGYQYIFFGNAFFISKQGYLLTAAHVLSAFRNGGGQPHILVSRPLAPPVMLEARLVAVDWEHDVALLRATPNPFEGNYKVDFLSLAAGKPVQGDAVLAVAIRPVRMQHSQTFEAVLHDRLQGEVLDFQFTQEETGAAETELFLFSHEVLRGQSGAPVVSSSSHEVVGMVAGSWLHPRAVHSSEAAADQFVPAPGAALLIHYAIALLQKQGIPWGAPSEVPAPFDRRADSAGEFRPPAPLSLVGAPYPRETLLGGEVLLDAAIDAHGRVTAVKTVHGAPPFLEQALGAVRTWTLAPARSGGQAVDGKIGIAFQFSQSHRSAAINHVRRYEAPSATLSDCSAQPILTLEPDYPAPSADEGSVMLYATIDREGRVASARAVGELPSRSAPAMDALRQWRFAPAKQAGQAINSATIVVFTFRRPAR